MAITAQAAIVGMCLLVQDRVQALQDEQPGRNTWRTALIGKEAFQLWDFKTNRSGRCLQSVSTALLSFSVETDSPGFQLFVRWLATDLKVGARFSPKNRDILSSSLQAIMGPCHAASFACEVWLIKAPPQQTKCLFLAAGAGLHSPVAPRSAGAKQHGH